MESVLSFHSLPFLQKSRTQLLLPQLDRSNISKCFSECLLRSLYLLVTSASGSNVFTICSLLLITSIILSGVWVALLCINSLVLLYICVSSVRHSSITSMIAGVTAHQLLLTKIWEVSL